MMTTEEILKNLQAAFAQKKEIRLVNAYKGLPISFPAQIVAINGEFVTVKSDRSQIVCMYRDHHTHIQCDLFPKVILAYVTQLDLGKQEAILSYFEVPKTSFNDREQIRVEPDSPTTGDIKVKDAKIQFRGHLADISLSGMGIFIEERLYSPAIYRPGSEITVIVHLPSMGKMSFSRTTLQYSDPSAKENRSNGQALRVNLFPELTQQSTSLSTTTYNVDPSGNFELRGIIVNATREAQHRRYRIGVRLQPSDTVRMVINHFINIRQTEIINEIRAEYQALMNGGQRPR